MAFSSMITLLTAKTGADQSDAFVVGHTGVHSITNPATVFADNLAGAETADLQISHDGGTTWTDVAEDTAAVELTATNNTEVIVGPGLYRLDKDVTAGACGIYLAYGQTIKQA